MTDQDTGSGETGSGDTGSGDGGKDTFDPVMDFWFDGYLGGNLEFDVSLRNGVRQHRRNERCPTEY